MNVEEHDRLYQEAVDLSHGLILLDGNLQRALSLDETQRLKKSIGLFEQVIEINSQNWAAMWMMGKIYQRLDENESAFNWFKQAHEIKPDQPDVAREAAIAACEIGRTDEAIKFCQKALLATPDDPGLKANLAMALLFSDRVSEAQEIVANALKLAPRDRITANLSLLIDKVASGEIPCPHTGKEAEQHLMPAKPWWKFW